MGPGESWDPGFKLELGPGGDLGPEEIWDPDFKLELGPGGELGPVRCGPTGPVVRLKLTDGHGNGLTERTRCLNLHPLRTVPVHARLG